MINNFFITGDTHGSVEERLIKLQLKFPEAKPEETAIIILGDAGINYWLNRTDLKNKKVISSFGYTIYCVRGNHEERPENLPTMILKNDPNVKGMVWMEEEFPLIRYFADGGVYNINNHSCLVLGGAYSVDKYWRIQRAAARNQSFSGWFKDEQLSLEEREFIFNKIKNKSFDFILSHTAPISCEPKDLFLPEIDQTLVEKDMEFWLEDVKQATNWGVWCWGHYHRDRIEAPYCEMFYEYVENIEDIWARWKNYRKDNYLPSWLPLAPNFYRLRKEMKNGTSRSI